MHRGDERGAFAVLAVLVLVVCMTVAAFAVDVAVSRVAARDMQAVSDLAALDAARELPNCSTAVLTAAARAAASRQVDAVGTRAEPVAVGGVLDPRTGHFSQRPDTAADCTAVKVTAATTVGYTFAKVFSGPASDTQQRSAVATNADPALCFSLGTRGLALDSTRSALSPLLEHLLAARLGISGYEGLVDLKGLTVPLLGLATELDIGSVQELAHLPALTLRDLFLASAELLDADGQVLDATVLRAIGMQLGTATVDLADILAVSTGVGSAVGAQLDVFDLVTAALLAANTDHAVEIPALGLTLPAALANATTRLTIIEPPRIACGGPGISARSAQVSLDLVGDVTGTDLAALRVNLAALMAAATATLTQLQCTAPPAAAFDISTGLVSVDRSPLGTIPAAARLSLTLDAFLQVIGPLRLVLGPALRLLGLSAVSVDVDLAAQVAAGQHSRTVTFEDSAPPAPVSVGAGGVARLGHTGVRLVDEGGLIGTILRLVSLDEVLGYVVSEVVTPLVNDTLDPLLSAVLLPTLEALGMEIATAELELQAAPSCSGVRLVQ